MVSAGGQPEARCHEHSCPHPHHRPEHRPEHRRGAAVRLANPWSTTLGERLVLAHDEGYDAARSCWNLAADLRPCAVVRPHSAEETAAVVRAVADLGLRIAPVSTGHAAATLAERDLGDVVMLRLDELTGVTVDPVARRARVLGGTLWNDVVTAAAAHGLAAPHGSAGDVSVAGYLLSGGLSFYGRRHGFAAEAIRSAEIVTAAGRLVHASATENPALLTALRGGGGNLGIVVSLEIDLLPYADVYAGMLLWPAAAGAQVAPAWAEWARHAPEHITTSLRLMRFPPLPELPPFLSGREVLVIDGASVAGDAEAEAALAPLRLLEPEMDTFARMPAAHLVQVHMDPPEPMPGVSDHRMLGRLDEAGVRAFIETFATTPVMIAELRQLGGALTRPGSTSLRPLTGEAALFTLAPAPTPELLALGTTATAAFCTALEPWSIDEAAITFSDRPADVSGCYADADALRRTVAELDPAGTLVAQHPLR